MQLTTVILSAATLAGVVVLIIRQEKAMADVKAELAAINDQLGKAGAEIVTKIGELEEKVANGTVTVEDLAPLKAQAQALDDIVPDAPTEPETPGDGEGTVTPPEDGTV